VLEIAAPASAAAAIATGSSPATFHMVLRPC
jgi:hypothetical protein